MDESGTVTSADTVNHLPQDLVCHWLTDLYLCLCGWVICRRVTCVTAGNCLEEWPDRVCNMSLVSYD